MSRYHTNHTTKIARLADQAHEQSNTIYNERLKIERADEVIFYDIFNQRFAELIVRECIQNIRDNMEIAKVDTLGDKDLFLETLRTSGHFYITELERHFGVEE